MNDDDHRNLLGICIPTYNRRAYLRYCLDSIISEFSKFNFPIYISDNASDDGTEEDIIRLKQTYENITYARNSINIGPYRNILNVISMANTDYIWLMGDDDAIKENSVYEIVKLLQNDFDFIVLNSISCSNDLKRVKADKIIKCSNNKLYPRGSHDNLFYDLRKWSYHGYMSSMVIRRDLLLNVIPDYEDKRFVLYDNSWLPLAMFYEAIKGESGIFMCEPVVLNRDNTRHSGKDFWNYTYVDRIMAYEYLHLKGYTHKVLKKSLNFNIAGMIFIATVAKYRDTKTFIFNKFIKTNKLIPFHIKLVIIAIDKMPSLVVMKIAKVINNIVPFSEVRE